MKMEGEIMKSVGINGIAGRIGKFTAYELSKLGVEISAVNDLASTDAIVESLSHRDGVHGNLEWKVEKIDEKRISINGFPAEVFHEKDPANIIWGNDIYVVGECAGPFTKREDAERHFHSSNALETVLISAPGTGDMKTLVMGVNHTDYRIGDRVVSNASCTTKALAVPMQVLIDAGVVIYGVQMVTTHAATNTQKPLDFMDSYGVLDVISSAKTGAAIATGKVIPYLDGKMGGFAMRVPTRNGSFANVFFAAEGDDLSPEKINSIFEEAKSNPEYCGRIDVFYGKEISSPDIIGNTASSVISSAKTNSIILPFQAMANLAYQTALIGIVSGYDNERAPAKDLAMLAKYVMSR